MFSVNTAVFRVSFFTLGGDREDPRWASAFDFRNILAECKGLCVTPA